MIQGIVERVASSGIAAFVNVGEERYLVYGSGFALIRPGEVVEIRTLDSWKSTKLVVGAKLLRKAVLIRRIPAAA